MTPSAGVNFRIMKESMKEIKPPGNWIPSYPDFSDEPTEEIITSIESEGYECIAGPLTNNLRWKELVKRALGQ